MNTKAASAVGVDIAQLITLAVDGLMPMFDAESELFCYRLQQEENRLIREGRSHRYTMISLLGLNQCERTGMATGFNVKKILQHLVQDTGWINNVGDLGLVYWLCALAWPDRLAAMSATWDVQNALERFGEVRHQRTTELSWFLAGLAHLSLVSDSRRAPEVGDVAARVCRLLRENQGDSGMFGHQARTGSVAGFVRGHIGSFADQVYPVYALSMFGKAYGVREALDAAGKCAEAICRAQGSLGQWWWHYDAGTGRVAESYPVYAVHQDGMAPMALFALADEARRDFDEAIYRGLQWIGGQNEIGCDLRDSDRKVIWRSVYHGSRYGVWRNRLQYAAGAGMGRESTKQLRLLRECRPYHFGWLLYAFAGRRSVDPATPAPRPACRAESSNSHLHS